MDPSKLGKKDLGITKKDIGTVDNIETDDVIHAVQNLATRRAATKMGTVSFNQFGEDIAMPAVMAQEVAWTEGRVQAGKDSAFNREQAEAVAQVANAERAENTRLRREPQLPGFEGV